MIDEKSSTEIRQVFYFMQDQFGIGAIAEQSGQSWALPLIQKFTALELKIDLKPTG